jgi:queuine tRNA-ribosyltransferase
MLLTWNNLSYYQDLMKSIREAIAEGRFEDFYAQTRDTWARGDIDRV